MKIEYLSPNLEILTLYNEGAVLSGSTPNDFDMEDFNVVDGNI